MFKPGIYFQKEEYETLRAWWVENLEKMNNDLGFVIYLEPMCAIDLKGILSSENPKERLNEEDDDIRLYEYNEIIGFNLDELTMFWLYKNVSSPHLRERFRIALTFLGESVITFLSNHLRFTKKDLVKPRILRIMSEGKYDYQFFRLDNNKITVFDSITVVGTTDFVKILKNESLNLQSSTSSFLVLYENLVLTYENGEFFINGYLGPDDNLVTLESNLKADFKNIVRLITPKIHFQTDFSELRVHNLDTVVVSLNNDFFSLENICKSIAGEGSDLDDVEPILYVVYNDVLPSFTKEFIKW